MALYRHSPNFSRIPGPWFIGNWTDSLHQSAGSASVTTWPAANRALYIPFSLPCDTSVSSIGFWCTTTSSGNYDLGLYAADGVTRLASKGSTALSGSAVNSWSPSTPILLLAGVLYYLGMNLSSASSTILQRAVTVNGMRVTGCAQEAVGSVTLPNPATPAQIASAFYPMVTLTPAGLPT